MNVHYTTTKNQTPSTVNIRSLTPFDLDRYEHGGKISHSLAST